MRYSSSPLGHFPQFRTSYEASAPASSSSGPELQSLKKRVADLEKAHSRSPRRNAQKQASLGAGPSMLAFPAPAPLPQQGPRMRRGGNRRSNKGQGKGSSTPSDQKNFESLMKLPVDFRKNFHEKYHKNEICFRFQSHICFGCGGSKPYDACRCLQSKIH